MSDPTPIPGEALEAAISATDRHYTAEFDGLIPVCRCGSREDDHEARVILAAVAPILLAAGRTAVAAEAEEGASATVIATRQMFNDANARLRSLLLAALGTEDDGKTSLTGYVNALIADRDAAHQRGRTAAADAALNKIANEVVGVNAALVHDAEQLRWGAIRSALSEGADQ